MATLTQVRGTAAFLVSEATGYRSRAANTVVGGAAPGLPAGTIMGRIRTLTGTAAAKTGGNTGDATISAVTTTNAADAGVYRVRFLTATTFNVIQPDGAIMPAGATGAAYAGGHLGFTITVGATPMIAGDGFDITVVLALGNHLAYDPTAVTGAEVIAGILYETTVGTVEAAVITRDCEVNAAHLIYQTGADAAAKATANAALTALGIIVR